jgi:hypothetical protein
MAIGKSDLKTVATGLGDIVDSVKLFARERPKTRGNGRFVKMWQRLRLHWISPDPNC